MKNKITVLFIFLIFTITIYSQLQWQAGGIHVNNDYPLYWYNNSGAVIDDVSYFVWSDSQSGNPDLMMQGYDTNGNPVWQNDLVVCDAAKYQGRGQVIAASDGNIIVSWHDTRDRPGLYFGQDYDIYLQKVTPAGEILWEDNDVYVGLCYPYDYRFISDDQGGCYLAFHTDTGHESPVAFWHIISDGTCCPNWETGIIIEGISYSYQILSDGDGNLIVFSPQDELSVVTKLSALGEVIWDEIPIFDYYVFNANLFRRENSVDIIFDVSNEIYMQQINDNGELVWDEPLLIFSSSTYLSTFYCTPANDGYYINFYESQGGNYLMRVDYQGEDIWTTILDSDYGFDGIKGMSNGNVRVWNFSLSGFTIWEYDGDSNPVGPEEGLWSMTFQNEYWYPIVGVFGEGNLSAIGWRDMTADQENEVLSYQLIDESGEPVCGAEGTEISRGRNSGQICKGVYKIDDLEIVLMKSYYMGDQRMMMKLFDEDGNIVGDPEGMPISDADANYAEPLGIYNDRLYFIMEFEDAGNPDSEVLYINAVDFSSEPELVWGEGGLYLGEGEFINTTINMTTIPGEDNTLLFSWNVQSPHGYGRVQKMVSDEFVWEDGGLIFPWLNFDTHRIMAYNDYILRMISWGNGYYLNRVDENGGMMWDDELLMNLTFLVDFPIAIPQENGNMLFLLGEHTTFGMQLVEYRITPEGENLSSTQGNVVNFLNGANYLKILDCGDNYAVITRQDDDSLILRRYNYDSTEIAEPVAIPDFDYYEITNVEILNDHLLIYSQTMFGGEKLSVYDFAGQPSVLLPENPYQYLEMSNYYVSAITCKDGDDIYFCWLDGGTSERPDEGEYGFNWYMQKFRIPTTENTENEVINTTKLQLYPNPFNPDLNISWEAENMENSNTEIAVYNVKGQQIRNWQVNSCRGCLTWDGKNNTGLSCSTGIYFVRITTGGKTISHKAVLLK